MNRILIIAPNWIGDAVMSQPLLANLKASYPQSQIDVLASPWVAPIYRACAEVHQVIEARLEHKQLQWGLRKQLARQLELNQYDACFVLPNSLKSALIPWLANIPLRIAYRGEMRFGLINFALDNPSKTNRPPMANHYLALSNVIQSSQEIDINQSADPKLNISLAATKSVSAKLQIAGINEKSIYVFCPGAEFGATKRWPTEHFATLAEQLITHESNAHVILLGSKGDHEFGKEIISQVTNTSQIQNWCGETSLDEAIALIGMSKALVSNDSGLMHIGAALKVPQVAIFGSSDPRHTPPLSDKAKVIWLNLPCSPCHKRECPLGHLKCLKDILPTTVLSAVQSLH
ncbi:MAG: lipopolysaccharide heptosyltransferase II [Polynucleobacter sp. 24-46-87]|uniref:lipopolysaccharide heptosyltransferase II n=1 Tax=unclassified Polynucleobacter TaxID=2640945 RepID=UPI000BC887B9|nr:MULTISPECIES: lipopolysaccharide heptosyltransferase II [unclassified Polynucleobacter]OYY17741.1 MAG: lipopolysaccharide heptosyltransferase II [Polynucleobacter sp. 35-46-11]OZA14235.1 MAG: lipopolysaccharide heptosyltransferase II [Polynucleobacter sp. 24-46-87]OZA74329.1 MAG: lipopolysaccharide heptosyltransferase II [Polynucleobacter sp. 39-46-10]